MLAELWKALKRRPIEFLLLSCWDETDWAASHKEQEVAVVFERTEEESWQMVAAAAAYVFLLLYCFPLLRYERQVKVA